MSPFTPKLFSLLKQDYSRKTFHADLLAAGQWPYSTRSCFVSLTFRRQSCYILLSKVAQGTLLGMSVASLKPRLIRGVYEARRDRSLKAVRRKTANPCWHLGMRSDGFRRVWTSIMRQTGDPLSRFKCQSSARPPLSSEPSFRPAANAGRQVSQVLSH